jgi:hypothetical protein
MSEGSGPKHQLPDAVVRYLASLGTTPDQLERHYPNTFEAFLTLSRDDLRVLDTIGAALALDDPKGDNHNGADAMEDADPTQDSGEKLKKYLCAVH